MKNILKAKLLVLINYTSMASQNPTVSESSYKQNSKSGVTTQNTWDQNLKLKVLPTNKFNKVE